MDHSVGVGVLAHHVTAVVDADDPGLHRVWDIDPGELAALQQEATLWGYLCVGADVAVHARDLATVVDLLSSGPPGSRDVDGGDPAAPVAHEAVVPLAVVVAARDVATVVDAQRGGLHASASNS